MPAATAVPTESTLSDTPAAATPLRLTMRNARLCAHADYQAVYKATRKQQGHAMSWFAALRANSGASPSATARVGITAGRVLGKSHERNRIKRRLREAIRRHVHTLPSDLDLILHPRRSVMTIEFTKLEAEVVRIFDQVVKQLATKPAGKA